MTLRPWHEHPAARDEDVDSVVWYEDREAGPGKKLADNLDGAVDFVWKWPDSSPLYRGRRRLPQIRRRGVDVFPYGVIMYFVRDGELTVVAYAHSKGRRGYWRRRLEEL